MVEEYKDDMDESGDGYEYEYDYCDEYQYKEEEHDSSSVLSKINDLIEKQSNILDIKDKYNILLLLYINNWEIITYYLYKNFIINELKINEHKKMCIICYNDNIDTINLCNECDDNCNICKLCLSSYIYDSIFKQNKYPTECLICNKNIFISNVIIDKLLSKIITTHELKIKLEEIFIYDYINFDNNYIKCINKSCNKILYIKDNIIHDNNIKCSSCDTIICVNCKCNFHLPASCNEYNKWGLFKNKYIIDSYDDIETNNYILLNCKKCPNCSIYIEKDPSCLKMQCKYCAYIFCWKCLDEYTDEHLNLSGSFYTCIKDKDTDIKINMEKKFLYFYKKFIKYNNIIFNENIKDINIYIKDINIINIINNFLIFYYFNNNYDIITHIYYNIEFKSLIKILKCVNKINLEEYIKKINILGDKLLNSYLIFNHNISESSDYKFTTNLSLKEGEEIGKMYYWYIKDLRDYDINLFMTDENNNKIMENNYIKYNYIYYYINDTLNLKIDLINMIIINNKNGNIIEIYRILKQSFICKICTFKNDIQFTENNICKICDSIQ